ncbi:MAG: hypothetical protein DRJ05_20325, partial [Bacteroidetes bacterium]
MAKKTSHKVPRFYGLRIYLSSTILYGMLILPFLTILSIKYAPEFQRRKQLLTTEATVALDSLTRQIKQNAYNEKVTDSLLIALSKANEIADTILSETDTLAFDGIEGSPVSANVNLNDS